MESSQPDTLTPSTCPCPSSQSQGDNVASWGRLYPMQRDFEAYDLSKSTFTLGRAAHCDVTVTKMHIANTLMLISKTHFTITRAPGESAYINDLSKNGTFLNQTLIGNGRRRVLQNDDVISAGIPTSKIYRYKKLQENDYLPQKLRKKYEISRLLGTGASGEVRLVIEKSTSKMYAVKKISKISTAKGSYLMNHPNKIRNEINILKTVTHPFVISTYEVEETDTAFFIIMEYMGGGELANRIASKKLSEGEVKFFFYQLITAVDYLHKQGITHRDLKPRNILLKTEKEETLLKVSDFGLSKIINEHCLMKTHCGTLQYAAPEVLEGKNPYSNKVDIWSLGVILYYMLSDSLPFSANHEQCLKEQILVGKYCMVDAYWTDVSAYAKDLVNQMLICNSEDRISIVDILKHPWINDDFEVKQKVKTLLREDLDDSSDHIPSKRCRLDD